MLLKAPNTAVLIIKQYIDKIVKMSLQSVLNVAQTALAVNQNMQILMKMQIKNLLGLCNAQK